MKLCKLKLKNLNSFRDEIVLDFEDSPLDDASLVAITGPTGAGKTTLLDAICVALYGKTPRLTGRDSQNPRHLISHGETEGFAEVHFVANGTRYRATWAVPRKGSPKGQLISTEDGKLISNKLSARGKSLGSSQNTVSEEITAILGLDFDAFKQSVMLAQGEFAAFLKAEDEDRREILEATAGIGIYDELRKALNKKVREVDAEHKEVSRKLDAVPEASPKQLEDAEKELGSLREAAKVLDTKNRQIQKKKERETKRKEEFAALQASEECQKTLLALQPDIDARQAEREHADRASRLLPEKQAFDSAKSEFQKAEAAFRQAKTELADAQKQSDKNQADFDEKDRAYQTVVDEGNRKIDAYKEAKFDVRQAQDLFDQVDTLTFNQEKRDKQIEKFSCQLTESRASEAELQQQIQTAQAFLDKNPLPSDRQSRLIRAKELLVRHSSQCQQCKEKSDDQGEYDSKIDSLNNKLAKLYQNREKLLAKKASTADSLANADTKLKAFRETGNFEEWQNRREQARQALSIAQRYEVSHRQLCEKEQDVEKLKKRIATLDKSLEDVKQQLVVQSHLCKRTDAEVTRLEAERELAVLADPIKELRQQLAPGQPCRVCGATEHPRANQVEHGSESQLKIIQNALEAAKAATAKAQEIMKHLKQKQVRRQQDKMNSTTLMRTYQAKIDSLRDKTESARTQWQRFYETAHISSEWVEEKIKEADTAIDNLSMARDAYNQASNALKVVDERRATCDRGISREEDLLRDRQQKLRTITADIEDLTEDIVKCEARFWELMPNVFHGVLPEQAVCQFVDRIKAVEAREKDLRTKQDKLALLGSDIRANQHELERASERHKELQAEIKRYQSKGEAFLNAASEKTEGLTTEDEIDTAIKRLDATLQEKADLRNKAEQVRYESDTSLTQAKTTLANYQSRRAERSENFETARDAYFDKLSDVGFDSPEAHALAFRDEVWIQRTQKKLEDFTREKHQLEVAIAELRTRFEETPFDPLALGTIIAQEEEIGRKIQEAQQDIGAQDNEIDRLKDALSKREALDDEVQAASDELKRWNGLQDTIPRNKLRDFALDIMFKQVSRIANAQLKYLTSGRYQLKVESIGKLTVVDRWNANEERPVETLSGGESFLTSLALALALSELSSGRAELSSLFLDEGFGTLDAETLDVAIAALEGLRMQGRSIFLISHVQELTRRLPVKINVKKQENGRSSIDIRG